MTVFSDKEKILDQILELSGNDAVVAGEKIRNEQEAKRTLCESFIMTSAILVMI